MIFFAPLIMSYVFWKTLFKEMNLDFDEMFPVVDYLVMCAK